MFPFNQYPFHNIQDFNLDWIIRLVKKCEKEIDTFTALTKITWAGEWDITKFYTQWALVDDNGNGYISIQPVPRNVPITDTNYWVLVADYSALYAAFSQRITDLENAVDNINNVELPNIQGQIANVQGQINNINNVTIPSFKYYVTPEMFGAEGDGVTDDTQAFNDALQYHIVICHSDKTYLISDNLTVLSDSIINGNNSTIKIKDNVNIENGIFSLDTISNVVIENFKFDKGTQADYPLTDVHKFYDTFILCNDCANISVRNCIFKNLHSSAIKFYDSDKNLSVTDCEFNYNESTMDYGNIFIHCLINKDTAQINISDNVFYGNVSDYNYGACGVFLADERSNVVIKHNLFKNMGRMGSPEPLAPVDCYKNNKNVIIDSNRFEHCIYMVRITSSELIKVVNNYYNNYEEMYPDTNIIPITVSSYYGLKEDTKLIDISNNTILSYAGSVYVIGISSQWDDFAPNSIIISNNDIYSPKGHVVVEKGAQFISINDNILQGGSSTIVLAIQNTNSSTIGAGNIDFIGNTVFGVNCVVYGVTNLLNNSGFVNVLNNKLNTMTAGVFNNNLVINGNTITQSGLAEQDVLASNPGTGELAYFTNNIVGSQFRIPSGTVTTHDNYYNGTLI